MRSLLCRFSSQLMRIDVGCCVVYCDYLVAGDVLGKQGKFTTSSSYQYRPVFLPQGYFVAIP